MSAHREHVIPPRTVISVALALATGAVLMLFRARYVESCWVQMLRLFHRHCVVAYITSPALSAVPFVYVGGVLILLGILVLRRASD